MREWRRATMIQECGGPCRDRIPKGAPVLVITIEGVKRAKVRCADCADEPVPADLPAYVSPQLPVLPSVPIPTGPDVLPLDFKPVRQPVVATRKLRVAKPLQTRPDYRERQAGED